MIHRVHGLGQLAQKAEGLGGQVRVADLDGSSLVHVVQQLVNQDQVGAGLGQHLAQQADARRQLLLVAVADELVQFDGRPPTAGCS